VALVALVGELCQLINATVAIELDEMRASTDAFPNRHMLHIGKTFWDAQDEPIPRVVALRPSIALGGAPVGLAEGQLAVKMVTGEVFVLESTSGCKRRCGTPCSGIRSKRQGPVSGPSWRRPLPVSMCRYM